MRTFDQCGTAIKKYAEAMAVVDEARQERLRLKMERSLDDSITDAYEQVDSTADCMEFPR